MSDLLKRVLDASGSRGCWREIEAVEVTLRLSRTVEIDGESHAVTVSYRREVVQITEGAGNVIITPSHHKTTEEEPICVDL